MVSLFSRRRKVSETPKESYIPAYNEELADLQITSTHSDFLIRDTDHEIFEAITAGLVIEMEREWDNEGIRYKTLTLKGEPETMEYASIRLNKLIRLNDDSAEAARKEAEVARKKLERIKVEHTEAMAAAEHIKHQRVIAAFDAEHTGLDSAKPKELTFEVFTASEYISKGRKRGVLATGDALHCLKLMARFENSGQPAESRDIYLRRVR